MWLLVVLVVEVVGKSVGCVFGRVPGGAPHKRLMYHRIALCM